MSQKRHKGISLRTLHILMIIAAAIISILILFTTYQLTTSFQRLTDASEQQIELRKDALELMNASDYLTESVQRFTVRGDMTFLEDYFTEAFEANRREEAIQKMSETVEGSDAIQKLRTALEKSVELMDLEYYAMRLVIEAKGYTDYPEILQSVTLSDDDQARTSEEKMKLATEMILGEDYYEMKDQIRENMRASLDELEKMAHATDDAALESLRTEMLLVRIVIILLTIGIIVMVWLTSRLSIRPVFRMVNSIEADKTIPEAGAKEFRYLARAYNQMYDDHKERLEKELQSVTELTELIGSMSSLLTNMPAMSFSKDAETGIYLACNQAFAEYAGKKEPGEVVGLTDHEIFDAVTAKHFVEDDQKALAMDGAYVFYEDVPDAFCSVTRYLQTTKKKYRDASGRLCLLGMCVDVTETTRAKAEEAAKEVREQEEQEKQAMEAFYKKDVERLSFQASHDELTGLYNRFGYDFIISEVDLSSVYLLVIDVDDFKTVNDHFGHEIGDRVLTKIADTLKQNFRSNDCICRVGGDEFVVVMIGANADQRQMIRSKIDKINLELTDTDDGLPAISVSVGIAYGSEADDALELLKLADRAMYELKRSGKRGSCFSDEL